MYFTLSNDAYAKHRKKSKHMASEYKGYTITHHKDGSFSCCVEYAKADGTKTQGRLTAKTLDELHARIDKFIAEREAEDKNYNDTLADIAKQIVETHNQVELGIKTVKEKTLEALQNAIKCGELLTKAKDLMKASGKWQAWFSSNCQGISISTEKRYRQLYRKVQANSSYVSQAQSLRQAYLLYGMIDDTPVKTTPEDKTEETADTGSKDTPKKDKEDAGDNSPNEPEAKPTAQAFTIAELVEMISENLYDLTGETLDGAIKEMWGLLSFFDTDELTDALIAKLNEMDAETAGEALEPLLQWHKDNCHPKTPRRKQKRISKAVLDKMSKSDVSIKLNEDQKETVVTE